MVNVTVKLRSAKYIEFFESDAVDKITSAVFWGYVFNNTIRIRVLV